MKRENSISRKIYQYIKKNHISVPQIAHDIGISEEKLMNEDSTFNATEFLEICSYLNVRPEDIK